MKCPKWQNSYQLATRLGSEKHIVKWFHQCVTSACTCTNWDSYSSLIVDVIRWDHHSIAILSLAEVSSCIWLYCNTHWSWVLAIPTTEQRKKAVIPVLCEYVSKHHVVILHCTVKRNIVTTYKHTAMSSLLTCHAPLPLRHCNSLPVSEVILNIGTVLWSFLACSTFILNRIK